MTNELMTASDAIVPIASHDAWATLANEWLTNFRSDATRRTYRAAWADFLAWLGKHPKDATRADVIAYRDSMTTKGAKAATVGVRLAALASFYQRAHAEGLLARNPAQDIDRPKVEAYAGARWLTTSEARAVLQSPNRATLEGKRDYAILVVMLTMGLRRNEVATMRRGDVRVKGDGGAELRYTPKGGDEKTRPMPTVAWHAIQAYLAARGEVATDAPMFMAHDRNAIHREAQPMSGEALRQLVNRYTVRALGRVVNPHALRHTCANEAWDTTKDLRRVQGMLGHASATTTERYLHRVTDDRAALGDALAVRLGIA